ncbi:hypothetical protein B0181_00375 [Moraxella caviae]|uniref:Beta-lactamase n=1 Tax=Moraxella caviae TaxID=34060 RepID=A0A1T0ACJ1_9GAMM|nr:class D beta-lactamase [Moraxella caviae]OOR93434.1 hypothetical protein B0181_00375 [Moraxella caviae]STZ14093.1 Beta-lactamase OXA-10 precursor [Moraxella caviae]
MKLTQFAFLATLASTLIACHTSTQDKMTHTYKALTNQAVAPHLALDLGNSEHQQHIAQLFDELHTKGVLVIYDGKHTHAYGNALQRADTYYSPASTFKIANAIIAIEQGVTNPNEVFIWHGEKRALKDWERDLTLSEAMRVSAVPVYQQIARRVGLDAMRQQLTRLNYGNGKIGNAVDEFWLNGELQITPKEQVKFVHALATNELAVSDSTQAAVRAMLYDTAINQTHIYGKTGLSAGAYPKTGWLAGFAIMPNAQVVSYALNMQIHENTPLSARKQLVHDDLEQLGVVLKDNASNP